jgi:hypothetical protein
MSSLDSLFLKMGNSITGINYKDLNLDFVKEQFADVIAEI